MGVIIDRYGSFDCPPLVYTLFALGFAKEASIGSRIADIQDALKSEYPIHETRNTPTVSVIQGADGNQTISTGVEIEYLFFCSDRKRGVILKSDRVVYHTSEYKDFPLFSQRLQFILTVIADCLKLSHYNSVGIRYVDAIKPKKGEQKLEDLLHQQIQPMPLERENLIHSTQTNVFKTSAGTLILKSYWLYDKAESIPPDLVGSSQLLRIEKFLLEAPFVVLDCDHNYRSSPDGTVEKLDIDALLEKVRGMHDATSEAFVNAINIPLWKEWNNA